MEYFYLNSNFNIVKKNKYFLFGMVVFSSLLIFVIFLTKVTKVQAEDVTNFQLQIISGPTSNPTPNSNTTTGTDVNNETNINENSNTSVNQNTNDNLVTDTNSNSSNTTPSNISPNQNLSKNSAIKKIDVTLILLNKGLALAGIPITLNSTSETVVTDNDGKALFRNLTPGIDSVSLVYDNGTITRQITIPSDGSDTIIQLNQTSQKNRTIMVTVLDNNNNPVSNISVWLSSGSKAVSDSQGNVFFYDVLPGEYTITFDINGVITNKQITVENISIPYDINITVKFDQTNAISSFLVTNNKSVFSDEKGIDVESNDNDRAQDSILKSITSGIESLQYLVDKTPEPVAQTITIAAPILILGTSAWSVLSSISSFKDLIYLIISLFTEFLYLLGIKKRHDTQGVIYDENTQLPIARALVIIKDKSGTIIAQELTDINGRFGFAQLPPDYDIVIQKDNYDSPKIAQKRTISASDMNIYGAQGIPLTPQASLLQKQKQLLHTKYDATKEFLLTYGIITLNIISIISAVILLYKHTTGYNILLVMFLVGSLIFNHIAPALGAVIDKTNYLKPFSIITFLSQDQTSSVLKKVVANYQGKYNIKLDKGRYRVEILTKDLDNNYHLSYQTESFQHRKPGFVNKLFKV